MGWEGLRALFSFFAHVDDFMLNPVSVGCRSDGCCAIASNVLSLRFASLPAPKLGAKLMDLMLKDLWECMLLIMAWSRTFMRGRKHVTVLVTFAICKMERERLCLSFLMNSYSTHKHCEVHEGMAWLTGNVRTHFVMYSGKAQFLV